MLPRSPPDDETETARHDPIPGPAQPNGQCRDDGEGEPRQQQGRQRGLALQHSEAHARIPDDPDVEERRDRIVRGTKAPDVEDQPLGEAITGEDREGEFPRPSATSGIRHDGRWRGIDRIPAPPTEVGMNGIAAHLRQHLPSTARTWSRRPGPARRSRPPPPRGGNLPPALRRTTSSAPDVMAISPRSSPSRASANSGVTWTLGRDWRLEPMRFSRRSTSRAPRDDPPQAADLFPTSAPGRRHATPPARSGRSGDERCRPLPDFGTARLPRR